MSSIQIDVLSLVPSSTLLKMFNLFFPKNLSISQKNY